MEKPGSTQVAEAIIRDREDTFQRAQLMGPLLDEVWRLRGLCALMALELNKARPERSRIPVGTLTKMGEVQESLELAACGLSGKALAGRDFSRALKYAGAGETLTRHDFEEELRVRQGR